MAEKIVLCGPKLRVAFQNHLVSLPELLLAEHLITDNNASEIRATYMYQPEPFRASRLLEFIRNKVKVDSDNYNVFVKALQKDVQYRDILIILGEKCPLPKDSPAAAPATSNTCLSITDLSKVFRELYAAHTKWYNIGLELRMNPHDLDTIRADYRDKPDECFRELLSRWLKNDSKPTWPVLVSALKSPTVGFEMLSEQVKENLSMSTVGSNDERQSVKSKGIEIGDLIIFSNKIIGQGGFGTVFKGEWQQRPCAAKMLSILGNEVYTGIPITQQKGVIQEESLSSFKKECEFMKTLRHPNVVAYYDTVFHPESNLPVLVMELMSTSLRHYITTHAESLSERVQLNFCHNIAAALEFLHGKNIIHRDLCGENVLLNHSDDNMPVAKVTDFGVSRKNIDMTHSLTAISHRPGYLPPEAPEYPADYDSSLDIFMFGAVMAQIAKKIQAIKSKGERQKIVRELGEAKHPLHPIICQCLNERKGGRPEASLLCVSFHYACEALATGSTHVDRITEEMQQLFTTKTQTVVPSSKSIDLQIAGKNGDMERLSVNEDVYGYPESGASEENVQLPSPCTQPYEANAVVVPSIKSSEINLSMETTAPQPSQCTQPHGVNAVVVPSKSSEINLSMETTASQPWQHMGSGQFVSTTGSIDSIHLPPSIHLCVAQTASSSSMQGAMLSHARMNTSDSGHT